MGRVQPIILAGGSGSRLWPMSRQTYPKQLLELTGNKSLLQTTLQRVVGLSDSYPPLVVVAEEHKFTSKKQIDELSAVTEYTILVEPLDRNTAPAICGAVEYARQLRGDNSVILVLPCDHLIAKPERFYEGVRDGVELASAGQIVTFGIAPLHAEVGYGYIEAGPANQVISFKEKPCVEQAREYIASGSYCWNSGMLSFTPAVFHKEMQRYAPVMQASMITAVNKGKTDGVYFIFDQQSMERAESSSIDSTLMEKTTSAVVVRVDMDWIDIGTWQALWQVLPRDDAGNTCSGDVIVKDTKNSLIMAESRLVATVGIEDTVVVETSDAVMVAAMSAAQHVKSVVHHLKAAERSEYRFHNTVYCSWGSYIILDSQQQFKVKKIRLKPSSTLFLQKHCHRYVYWVVISGTAKITNGKDVFLLSESQSASALSVGVACRLENPGAIPLEIIQIQIGSYLVTGDTTSYTDDNGYE